MALLAVGILTLLIILLTVLVLALLIILLAVLPLILLIVLLAVLPLILPIVLLAISSLTAIVTLALIIFLARSLCAAVCSLGSTVANFPLLKFSPTLCTKSCHSSPPLSITHPLIIKPMH